MPTRQEAAQRLLAIVDFMPTLPVKVKSGSIAPGWRALEELEIEHGISDVAPLGRSMEVLQADAAANAASPLPADFAGIVFAEDRLLRAVSGIGTGESGMKFRLEADKTWLKWPAAGFPFVGGCFLSLPVGYLVGCVGLVVAALFCKSHVVAIIVAFAVLGLWGGWRLGSYLGLQHFLQDLKKHPWDGLKASYLLTVRTAGEIPQLRNVKGFRGFLTRYELRQIASSIHSECLDWMGG